MKQSKRYKVIKEILGGVTHDVVYKVGDTVNENIFNGMLTGFLISNGFLEPIPETPCKYTFIKKNEHNRLIYKSECGLDFCQASYSYDWKTPEVIPFVINGQTCMKCKKIIEVNPIPEKKMEVVERKPIFENLNKSNNPYIQIFNPTQLMKKVVNAIAMGEYYERWISEYGRDILINKKDFHYSTLSKGETDKFKIKTIIIPIENEVEK